MPEDFRVVTTRDQKPVILRLVRDLPAMLAGRVPDPQGIASGFRSRIGYAILSLVYPNFEELSRGQPGADGDRWPALSKEYLAYGKAFGKSEKSTLKKKAGLDRSNQHRGLLTIEQDKLWRRTYARYFAKFVMQEGEREAAAHAAAIAWIVVKKAGAKTKLEVFGNRQTQILVNSGRGAASLLPGQLQEDGTPRAEYYGNPDQVFDIVDEINVGTNVGYMGAHHRGGTHPRNKLPRRRLWPTEFPPDWWRQILGAGISGLVRIGTLFGAGRL